MAECASQLRVLSRALDLGDLRLDNTASLWRQELVRLQGAALGLDTKERLLEAWGLVLLANNQLEPQNSGNLVLQSEVSMCRSVCVCICVTIHYSILSWPQVSWRGWCHASSSSRIT